MTKGEISEATRKRFDTSCFTLVFEGDVRAFTANPLSTETPFGVAYGVSIGDAMEREDIYRDALQTIRAKVHAHNRGGELYAGLRDVIRDICDDALDGRTASTGNDNG